MRRGLEEGLQGQGVGTALRHEAQALSQLPSGEVEVIDLVAGYDRPVVGPLSFNLAPGRVLGLSGPNGAGKSTLLAALIGAARIFGGSIRRPPGLRIAFQRQHPPQAHGLPLTGRELLELAAAPCAGLPEWLTPALDRRLDALSGGQRQFLHHWATLMSPADAVLLDEPTNNMDPVGMTELRKAIRGRAPNTAIALISHERDFLESVCDRIVRVGEKQVSG
ncbi:MAG: ATP-binding cassette domain-containing protein [Alphaproteobacteria bacterium]|nr:ATP-binding cassette domain-containing protein [Alphaproteobacteria bacterium]